MRIHAHSPSHTSRAALRRVRVTAFGVTLLAFGLLLWARLLLVTNHPRTAIADPAAAKSAHTPGR